MTEKFKKWFSEGWFYNTFDAVAGFITSMAIVIIAMIPFMGYRFYEIHTLFNKWLPIADSNDRSWASSLISSVLIVVTLIFMVNASSLFRGSKVILFLVALIINLFFWSLIKDPNWMFVIFISLTIASMDYGLPHLFQEKWTNRNIEQDITTSKQTLTTLKQKISRSEEKLSSMQEEYKQLEQKVLDAKCPYCGEIFPTGKKGVNAHKALCPENPDQAQNQNQHRS